MHACRAPVLFLMEHTLALLDRIASWRGAGDLVLRDTERLGILGERAAYFHLRRRNYIIVAQRWVTPFADGEADLIGWDGETLCFIEVKTRSTRAAFAAEFAIDERKQRALHAIRDAYVRQLPWPSNDEERDVATRFDVVTVYMQAGSRPDLRVLPGAFA